MGSTARQNSALFDDRPIRRSRGFLTWGLIHCDHNKHPTVHTDRCRCRCRQPQCAVHRHGVPQPAPACPFKFSTGRGCSELNPKLNPKTVTGMAGVASHAAAKVRSSAEEEEEKKKKEEEEEEEEEKEEEKKEEKKEEEVVAKRAVPLPCCKTAFRASAP